LVSVTKAIIIIIIAIIKITIYARTSVRASKKVFITRMSISL
jgi:hypothetical protein